MEISFKNKSISELCVKKAIAERKLGAKSARKLRNRLGDIEAASRVTELIAGNPHPLRGDRKGQFSLALDGGCRLTFIPNHDPCPEREDGSLDWNLVTKVCIEFVGDYHD